MTYNDLEILLKGRAYLFLIGYLNDLMMEISKDLLLLILILKELLFWKEWKLLDLFRLFFNN